jgi:hypothetical protein
MFSPLECFVAFGFHGCNASEVPFSDLASACDLAGIHLFELKLKDKTTLLTALCRVPATKIVNLTIFIALYKRWGKLAANLRRTDGDTTLSTRVGSLYPKVSAGHLQLYVQNDNSGLAYILDLFRDRLFPADLKTHKYEKSVGLSGIIKLCGVPISPVQKLAIKEFCEFADLCISGRQLDNESENAEDILIDMQKLRDVLDQLNPYRSVENNDRDHILIETQSNLVTRLVRFILPYGAAICEILENMKKSTVDGNFNLTQFKCAARESGLMLGHPDFAILWDFLHGPNSRGEGTVPLAKLKRILSAAQQTNDGESIIGPIMGRNEPLRILKSAEAGNICHRDSVASIMRHTAENRPGTGGSQSLRPPCLLEKQQVSNLTNIIGRDTNESLRESNCSIRIKRRVLDLTPSAKCVLGEAVDSVDDTTRDRRSVLSAALLSVGIRHTAKEMEQVMTDIKYYSSDECGCQNLSSRQLREWFGLADRPASTNIDSENMIGEDFLRHGNAYEAPRLVTTASNSSRQASIEPNTSALDRRSTEAVSINGTKDFPAPGPSTNLDAEHMTQALNILIDQRPLLAYVFRKLSYPGCRLQEFSLSCRSLAAALIAPPLSLPLTLEQSWRLVCEMSRSDPVYDYETGSILYADVLAYLDRCREESVSNMVLRQQIRQKLIVCPSICGDKLKLMALTPLLRQRIKQQRQRSGTSNRHNCGNGSTYEDFLNIHEVQSLFGTIELNLTQPEVQYLCVTAGAAEFSYGEWGTTLVAAINWLCNLLTPECAEIRGKC